MAGGEDDSDDQSVKSAKGEEGSTENCFKCCGKSTKIVVCASCSGVFHASCAKRQSAVKFVSAGVITCCSDSSRIPVKENESLLLIKAENNKLQIENHLLRQLIDEMRDKNAILQENNGLLCEKIRYMDEKTSNSINGFDEYSKKRIRSFSSVVSGTEKENKNHRVAETWKMPDNYSSSKGRTNITVKSNEKTRIASTSKSANEERRSVDTNPARELNTQIRSRTEVTVGGNKASIVSRDADVGQVAYQDGEVNINKTNTNTQALKSSEVESLRDGEWKVQRRRRKAYKKTLGENAEENVDFVGVKPRIWMYINRVESHVNEEGIIRYLKKKTDENEEFVVRDLKAGRRYKSFLVAADFKFKDEFYSPTFWPRGVGYKRCNFRLLEKAAESKSEASFLEIKK